jgi:hypothetical protein
MLQLVKNGWLKRLRKLDLSLDDGDAIIDLIDAPDAASIRSLELFSVSFEGHHASLLLPEARALQPEQIGFHHLEITADDFRAMADSAFMARVKHLVSKASPLTNRRWFTCWSGRRCGIWNSSGWRRCKSNERLAIGCANALGI